ncbi:MAG: F0F1 ATP synthase subunit A, partial [Pirellulales bacterium]|nr:F0F1 ATP synthase subunit A [Pirellulales bacterium]
DSDYFEVPRFISSSGHLTIPQPFYSESRKIELGGPFAPLDLKITKFMVLELIVAVVMAAIFIRLAGKITAAAANGDAPKGRFANMFEAALVFIRDGIARPAIGHHDGDKFLPYLWTLFFFVLLANLLGILPWMGSATGSIATTGALAVITLAVVIGAGSAKLGIVGFWKGLVPHMDLPKPIAIFLIPLIFAIELLGLIIKHFVLSVRLLANMFAGHLVLAVVIGFIGTEALVYYSPLWFGVTAASVFGAVALNMLELLVAFIQAYIFTFLSALFIGMAVHPH